MAELVQETPALVEVDEGLLASRPRISWGAIFGGAVSALGVWLMLYAFGLAIGLSAIDANDPGSVRSSGIFTGVWGLIAPLIALFVGGLVAGRVSTAVTRGQGATHGLVMWGLATVAGAFMFGMTLAAIFSGAAAMARTAVQAGGAAAGAGADPVGLNADDALAPVNQRLQAEGKSPVTAEELQAAVREVAQTAAREGRFDRDILAAALARNTALSPADAQEIAMRVENQYEQARSRIAARVDNAADRAKMGALKAADATGKAFWGVFGALLLGLIAALVGGALGVPGWRGRRLERLPVAARPAARVGPPREVYP